MRSLIAGQASVLVPDSAPDQRVVDLPDRLLDLLPAAVYVCDRDGVILRYNRRAAELWGRAPAIGDPAERFSGSHRMYRLDGGPLPHAQSATAEVLRSGAPVRDREVVIERPDGSRIVALANIDALRDDAGDIVGAVNCFNDITQRKRAEEELRASQHALHEAEQRLAAELAGTRQLQDISAQLIHEEDAGALYEKIVDAAVGIMRSDYASMQMLHPERGSGGELRLLAFRGFNAEAARFWEWVRADSESTCGVALRTGKRAIAPNVATCDFMAGTDDLATYLQTGIHAVQTTPLVSRSGRLLGMISTHWNRPHDPPERDLRLLDVLARQAADLIERAQAEEALRRSEERLQAIFKSAAIGAAILTPAARFIQANDAFCSITGYSVEELRSLDCTVLTHPDDCAHMLELIDGLVAGRMPSFTIEKRYFRKDGATIWVQNSVSLTRDAAGEPLHLVALCQDVTERRRAHEAQQHLALIVESSDDSIVSKDLNGILLTWNQGAERLYGYTAAEAIGQPATMLNMPGYRDDEPEIIERIGRGERIEHYETVRRRKDGSLVDVSLTVSPVRDAEGRIVGASTIARDISERIRAQEEQNLLLAEMSHRVKNLFAVTAGLVALSARSARSPQDMVASLQERLAALTRAHELTRPGLIGLNGESGEDTTLHALIRTIFAPYVSGRSKARESVVIAGTDLPIGGNSITNVALVLHELATNAAKYGALSSPEGIVHIDCALADDELVLTWSERGGPALQGEPESEGFGGLLTRRVSEQFGGRLSKDWQPDGLTVRLCVPATGLAA